MASRRRNRARSPVIEKDEHSEEGVGNAFKNDGSFLEMFMKSQKTGIPIPGTSFKTGSSAPGTSHSEGQEDKSEASIKKDDDPPKPKYGFVGKRRGGKILPTGKVKKSKQEEEEDETSGKKDAWSQYLSEVKKYKSQSCQDEVTTRPLVK